LQAIIEECKRCRRITGGLLGFARSSAGEFGAVDLSRLVAETLVSLRPQKLFKYLDIEVIAPPLPTVWADVDKLRQVLVNLCLNAAQAMAGEGRLVLRTLVQGADAVIEVSDSGPGIPPEACEKIFEPFFSTKGRGEGTGLGLSICRRLVEDHGGTLTVECRANASTCFRLAIPLGNEEKYFDKSSDDSIG
jgi:signal transduction histidine kinase